MAQGMEAGEAGRGESGRAHPSTPPHGGQTGKDTRIGCQDHGEYIPVMGGAVGANKMHVLKSHQVAAVVRNADGHKEKGYTQTNRENIANRAVWNAKYRKYSFRTLYIERGKDGICSRFLFLCVLLMCASIGILKISFICEVRKILF